MVELISSSFLSTVPGNTGETRQAGEATCLQVLLQLVVFILVKCRLGSVLLAGGLYD
jgi:hypothetical protein